MTDKPKKAPQFDYLLPPEECERVYQVLGGEQPGLDPCGHPDQFLKASKIMYGMGSEDDGFQADWAKHKTVFLNATHGEREPDWDGIKASNPEWARPDWEWHPFSRWITKASVEAQRGATIVAFMPASTDRKWFHQYVVEATSIVFLEQRVKCYVPRAEDVIKGPQPMNAHMVALWTKDSSVAENFWKIYKARGMIVEPRPVEE